MKKGGAKQKEYNISLDNKQVASIVVIVLFLAVVLFLSGFFLGKKKCDIKAVQCETDNKNVAIINTKSDKTDQKDQLKKFDNIKNNNVDKIDKKDQNIKKDKTVDKDNKKDKLNKKNGDKTENVKNFNDIEKKIKGEKKENKKVEKSKDSKDNKPDFKNLNIKKEGKFVLQIMATRDKKEGDDIVKKLKNDGYPAFLETTISKGTKYYRIRIGYFSTREDAKDFRKGFEKNSRYSKTFIIGVN